MKRASGMPTAAACRQTRQKRRWTLRAAAALTASAFCGCDAAVAVVETAPALGSLVAEAGASLDGSGAGAGASAQKKADEDERVLSCHMAMHKLMLIIDKSMVKKARLDQPILEDDLQGYGALKMREGSEDARKKVFAALGRADLNSAIQSGWMWTVDDHERMLDACYGKDVGRKLEEPVVPSSAANLMQGDIIMRTAGGSLLELSSSTSELSASAPIEIWPGGKVKYCIHPSLSQEATAAFKAAVDHTVSQVGCLELTEVAYDNASCSEVPSILVQGNQNGCFSDIGMASTNTVSKSQILNLGVGCETMGFAAHQLGHALGLVHAHVRKDRDDWLAVNEERTDMTMWPKYDTPYPAAYFDHFSLMLVPSHAFSRNGLPTVNTTKHHLLERYIGQRVGFSEDDVKRLGYYYSCKASDLRPVARTSDLNVRIKHDQALVTDGSCEDARDLNTYSMLAGSLKAQTCVELESLCRDPAEGGKLGSACPRTCMTCLGINLKDQLRDQVMAILSHNFFSTWAEKFANYTSFWSLQPRQAAPPVCKDAYDTEIDFTGGGYAMCADLLHYCQNEDMGAKVREKCPMTCGLCPLEARPKSASNFSVGRGCSDAPKADMPRIVLNGNAASCEEIKGFCEGHPDSLAIGRKCPVTCGKCLAPPSTTGGPTNWNDEPTYDNSSKVGCTRRRRWGFCGERRRRG
eukprot:TRINITY_DN46337_c0_g1_i1.p1 TRINITY_DN46337_c0_g1~~TRINITY_DN46337_c0_g1_i1.p1  ORF type:complete len:692 (-),score=127.26 TRINITY_DN46337_c0_g1_i1:82-2157(-)